MDILNKQLRSHLAKFLPPDFKFFLADKGHQKEVILISKSFADLDHRERHNLIHLGLNSGGFLNTIPPLILLLFTPEEWEEESRLDH